MTWNQVYRDNGLKWEKVVSVKPPVDIDAVYSLRITQARRAIAYRDADFIRFLTIAPDHDSAYGTTKPMAPAKPMPNTRNSPASMPA
jgi:hypothetical protein